MANPDNALGTNGAFGGRTSVNAFNDVLSTFSGRGVLSGWECVPASGLNVNIGGVSGTRDVAIAEDPGGNKTTVNNISQAPVSVTLPAAPASNSRIDSIVAYIESSPSSDAVLDNPDAVNLLVVSGSTAASPTAPTDSQIRTAITGDGASGATAYYVVLANVTMAAGTTDIDASMISAGTAAVLASGKIDFTTMPQEILCGTSPSKSCAYGSTDITVTLPKTLDSNNYKVCASLKSGGAGWGENLEWKLMYYTTNSFVIQVWNKNSAAIAVAFDWILVHDK